MKRIFIMIGMAFFINCVNDKTFDPSKGLCENAITANRSFREVKDLFVDSTIQIQEDLVIEGYVISSDRQGNFFNTLHFQDSPVAPTEGLQLDIELGNSHLFYEIGTKISIKLQGLYLGKSKSVYKLGGVFTAFANESVGRLPASKLKEHLFVSCDDPATIVPTNISIKDLEDIMINTLIRIDGVELIEDEKGHPYAVFGEETKRTLTDCDGNKMELLNSGFSDFQEAILPEGNGAIMGVLHKENKNYRLRVRDTVDIDFSKERCKAVVNENSSEKIFISELADPDNNKDARFVELYNAADASLDLTGWSLRRYTNNNTEVGSKIDLSEHTISAKSTLVIAPDGEEFEKVYGFKPDMTVTTNSPADSNGDDNLELVDPFDKVIDTFGVIGEDGSGTNHEFEDGRAVRKTEIVLANATYNFSEWLIFNDSGGEGTVNLPQNAPEDFSPGSRN